MLCPICLKERKHFEKHHVIWKNNVDGGSNDPVNLLNICKTCHAILTFGESESGWYDMACVAYQQMVYGLNFELKARKDVTKSSLLNEFIDCEKAGLLKGNLAKKANEIIKELASSKYRLAMAIIHELITEEEFNFIANDSLHDPDEIKKIMHKGIFCFLNYG
jgi:hypothetical protein